MWLIDNIFAHIGNIFVFTTKRGKNSLRVSSWKWVIFDSLLDFLVPLRNIVYIILQHKQSHGIFQPFKSWRPRTCVCPALATWLLFPRVCFCVWVQWEGCLVLAFVVPIWTSVGPIWMQQCWFPSLVRTSTWVQVVGFQHAALAHFFPSQRHPTEWEWFWWPTGENISKARVGLPEDLSCSISSWDLKAFFWGSPVLKRNDKEVLWCIQMLVCYLGGWGQVSVALNMYSALESFRLACEGAETHF